MYNDVLRASATFIGPAAKQLLDRALGQVGKAPGDLTAADLPALADAAAGIAGKMLGDAKAASLRTAIVGVG